MHQCSLSLFFRIPFFMSFLTQKKINHETRHVTEKSPWKSSRIIRDKCQPYIADLFEPETDWFLNHSNRFGNMTLVQKRSSSGHLPSNGLVTPCPFFHVYVHSSLSMSVLPCLCPFFHVYVHSSILCSVIPWFSIQGLVIASVKDMNRPPDKISPAQVGSLGLTGVIWARYSLVIIPKNWLSFSVNCFVALSNFYQLYRVYSHQQSTQIEGKWMWIVSI